MSDDQKSAMDDLQYPMFGKAPGTGSEMTRGQQTAWIVTAIAVVGFLGIGFSLTGQDPKFPRCELGFMGIPDKECRGDEAMRHLRSLR